LFLPRAVQDSQLSTSGSTVRTLKKTTKRSNTANSCAGAKLLGWSVVRIWRRESLAGAIELLELP
jgi:hypothetical protein